MPPTARDGVPTWNAAPRICIRGVQFQHRASMQAGGGVQKKEKKNGLYEQPPRSISKLHAPDSPQFHVHHTCCPKRANLGRTNHVLFTASEGLKYCSLCHLAAARPTIFLNLYKYLTVAVDKTLPDDALQALIMNPFIFKDLLTIGCSGLQPGQVKVAG
jgi:hypothetical protein